MPAGSSDGCRDIGAHCHVQGQAGAHADAGQKEEREAPEAAGAGQTDDGSQVQKASGAARCVSAGGSGGHLVGMREVRLKALAR